MKVNPDLTQPVGNNEQKATVAPYFVNAYIIDIAKLLGLMSLLHTVFFVLYPDKLLPLENGVLLAQMLATMAFLWFYQRRAFWPSFSELGITFHDCKQNLAVGLAWGVLGRLVQLGIATVTLIAMKVLGLELVPPAERFLPVQAWGWVAYVVLAVVIAPILEELIFRGILFPWLSARYGRLLGLLLSSGIFATMHGLHPSSLLSAFTFGIMLAILYEEKKSLSAPIIAHGVLNLTAIVLKLVLP